LVHPLLEPFRHHVWAMLRLIEVFRELDPAVLAAPGVPGTYGSPVDTFRHVLGSEAGYRFRLTGTWPDWTWARDGSATLDELEASVHETARFWEGYLAAGPDTEALLPLMGPDEVRYRVPVSVVLSQVLCHGSDHRGQVCVVLTASGVRPPVLDGWVYGKLSGRIVRAVDAQGV
jgi:uncharacterized damage-inducible protein DinB